VKKEKEILQQATSSTFGSLKGSHAPIDEEHGRIFILLTLILVRVVSGIKFDPFKISC
jgi:hypothetical protein